MTSQPKTKEQIGPEIRCTSKGSFLVGFVVLLFALMYGRPRIFQLIMVSLAALGGGALLSVLPRMAELSKSDQGIQGRVLAWNSAWESLQQFPRGVGWNNFYASFMWEGELVLKATHSSYVQIGASLGYVGLFLYVGVLYSWFRTLLFVQPTTVEQDRIRRVLFVLASASALSNWMIDRAYHTEFFLLTAAVGAYHRLVARKPGESEESEEGEERESIGERREVVEGPIAPEAEPVLGPLVPVPSFASFPSFAIAHGAIASGAAAHHYLQPGVAADSSGPLVREDFVSRFLRWPRLMVIDLPLIYLGYRLVLEIWEYTILNF